MAGQRRPRGAWGGGGSNSAASKKAFDHKERACSAAINVDGACGARSAFGGSFGCRRAASVDAKPAFICGIDRCPLPAQMMKRRSCCWWRTTESANVIETRRRYRATRTDARPVIPGGGRAAAQGLTGWPHVSSADELARSQIEKTTIERFSLSDITLAETYPETVRLRETWPSENDLLRMKAILDRLLPAY